jgi:hypothetical protein
MQGLSRENEMVFQIPFGSVGLAGTAQRWCHLPPAAVAGDAHFRSLLGGDHYKRRDMRAYASYFCAVPE